MKKKITTVTEDERYLSQIPEFEHELPINCLFHKGKTGCGGTSIALENDIDTIITVPLRALIINKQREDYLCIYTSNDGERVSDNDIKSYLKREGVKKILVTYDSLSRLVKVMQENDLNPYANYRLIVDEYQILFTAYNFRHTAIRALLNEATKFEKATFMTATPIKEEYLFHELKKYKVQEVVWLNEPQRKISVFVTNSILQGVNEKIRKLTRETPEMNLHIFVNSVKLIAEIIRYSELTEENVRIICSDTTPSIGKSNKEKLPFNISNIKDEVKKFNFYTSCAFEGCDIMDEHGKTIIVSSANHPQTLLDISTSIPQITGRIRNSRYKYDILHISTFMRSEDIEAANNKRTNLVTERASAIDFVTDISRLKPANIKIIKEFHTEYKRYRDKSLSNYLFWNAQRKILQCDKTMFDWDIYTIDNIKHVYSSPRLLAQAYQRNGFAYHHTVNYFEPIKRANDDDTSSSFRESFEKYVKLKESPIVTFCFTEREQDTIARWHPLIPKAYTFLGKETVRELNYRKSDIQVRLYQIESEPNKQAIRQSILERLSYDTRYTGSLIKSTLQEIYDVMGINKTATALDIKHYFPTEDTQPKIKGKTTRCYMLKRQVLPHS